MKLEFNRCLLAIALIAAAAPARAAELLAIDLNGAGGPTTTAAGWTGWNPGTGTTASTTVGPYGVTIFTPVAGYSFDGRNRGTPSTETGNGFIPSGLGHMYRDFVFVAAGGTQGRAVLGVTVTGLAPSAEHTVTVYAFDNNTAAQTNYTATPPLVNSMEQPIGYDHQNFPPHVSLNWNRPFNEFGDGANTPLPGVSFSITTNAAGVGSFYAWGGNGVNGQANAQSTYLNGFSIAANIVAPVYEADFDSDGRVDGDDLEAWTAGFGTEPGATKAQGDADANGAVDGADLLVWQEQLGNGVPAVGMIPEPSTVAMGVLATTLRRRSRGASRAVRP